MKKALFIGFTWPEPNATALGWRILQIIDLLKKQGYEIHFASAYEHPKAQQQLELQGIKTKNIELNADSFNTYCADLQPNMVIYDRFLTEEQFGWRVRESCPNAIQVLDTEDLHFLRKARETQVQQNLNEPSFNNKETYRELASIYRCDSSLIISKFEYNLLFTQFSVPKERLFYLPFLVNPISENELKRFPKYENRKNFVFIGTAKHKPNIDAVNLLKSEIWPKIRNALPKAELEIYGSYWEDKIAQYHNPKQGFLMNGFAESTETVHKQARVSLVPLQFGAGLKGKVFDAAKYGCPTVLTAIAAEGFIEDTNFISENTEQFVSQSIELYQNETKWQEVQQKMLAIYNEFDRADFAPKFQNCLENLQRNLTEIRQHNHIRNILTLEELESKKYLSKWIMEKNK